MSLLVVDESHLLQRDYDNHLVPRKLCRESCLTEEPFNTILKERIGRRKEEDGKVIWISQPKWEDEKRRLEGEESRQKFPFRLDDSEKKSKIVISSPALVTVVQRMIPQRLFESVSDEVAIEEPFASLFHFVDDMRKDMISRRADTKDMDDIDALEYFLYESQPQYKKARDALGNGRTALVSFETLWALFKAGEFIITTDKFEEKRLFKFTHLEEKHLEEKSDRVSGGRDLCVKLSVCGWCISWDREHKCFSQKSCIFYIERFLGHRNVRSLPVYPLRCEEEETRKSLVADLEKRGRNWTQLASNTPCCFEYDGTAIEIEIRRLSRHRSEMNTQLDGRVILDHAYQSSLKEMFQTNMDYDHGAIIEEKLHDTPTGAAETLIKAEHFMLCPPTLGCFHISSGKKYDINIQKLKPTAWSHNAMDSLIIDLTKKTRLECLIRNYTRIKGGDIIRNKGRGLTIVLYGPSGVGKTLTAECLAEYANTPLIPLSVGNLVADEDLIEDRLSEAFDNASRMKAILLLDEADVVLEERSFEDVRRNGIVSIFLRQLEYYKGILFLTTNRITSMDPAFQSRIQMAISYEELMPPQRELIWKSLLKTVLVDVTDVDKVVIERELPSLSEYSLNGRQIRNTLRLATILALDDLSSGGKVQLKHVKDAMREALQFQEFFEGAKKNHTNKNRIWKPFAPSQNGI